MCVCVCVCVYTSHLIVLGTACENGKATIKQLCISCTVGIIISNDRLSTRRVRPSFSRSCRYHTLADAEVRAVYDETGSLPEDDPFSDRPPNQVRSYPRACSSF